MLCLRLWLPLPPRWLICGFIGSGEACLCRESGGVPLRPLWAAGHWEGMSSVSPGTNLPRWFGATSEFTALREPAVVNVAYGTEMVRGWVWSVGVGTTLSEYPSPLLSTPESLFQKLFTCLHWVLVSSLPSEPPGRLILLARGIFVLCSGMWTRGCSGMWTLGCGMWGLVPWPQIEPKPLHWKYEVLATGPPGKSSENLFLK